MKPTSLELLAPARNKETAFAAIDCGADAVYMGFERFGARVSAGNSLADITQVVNYAHLFGVKVYVTLNTIIYNNEIDAARQAVKDLYQAGVNAIIVQDMAYLQMNECNMTIHASTQANNFTKEKVKWFENAGIERVVLARELSIEDIKEIHSYCPNVELEFFIHGALCCSVSGRCYLSHYQTGRSANRGECCQSCRSSYDLLNENGEVLMKDAYLLSTKDFNASSKLEDLIKAGVVSFKIEGRLKDINYVRNVTAYYSELMNDFCKKNPQYKRSSYGKVDLNFSPDVSKSFNRGFTIFNLEGKSEKTGNLKSTKSLGKVFGRVIECKNGFIKTDSKEQAHNGDGIVFFDQKGDLNGLLVNAVTANGFSANKKISIPKGTVLYRNKDVAFDKQLSGNSASRSIWIDAYLSDNELRFQSENNVIASISFEHVKEAVKNTNAYEENLRKQIGKLGDTVFALRNFSYNCSEKYFFPNSLLADLRRRCCDLLTEKLKETNRALHSQVLNKNTNYISQEVDYQENVSNDLSKEFYEQMGVRVCESAVEINPNKRNHELMRSKNCLRFNLGQCLRRDKLSKGFEGDLFLRDNQHTYRLSFDCSNCMMSVWAYK